MKLSIRKSIFLPVVIILLSIPILTYIVFNKTSSIFMEKQARYDLMMLLKTIEPFVDHTFGKYMKYPPRTKEEQLIFKQQLFLMRLNLFYKMDLMRQELFY